VNGSIDIIRLYQKIASRWWLPFILMVVGAAGALIYSSARAPIYQASAIIHVSIDYSRTASMDGFVETMAYDRVRALLLADRTLQAALQQPELTQSQSPGVYPDIVAVRRLIRLARRADGWEMDVFGPDPRMAADFANAWARVSIEEIEQASLHAIRAARYQKAIFNFGCELQPSKTDPSQAQWVCGAAGSQPPEPLDQALLDETTQSYGILPVFTYALDSKAAVPSKPVLWGRGALLLAGAFLGLLIGVGVAVIWPADAVQGEAER
jgi:LPS O-antigen subunit length determinant protein (WzzB/FepE family)